MNHIPVKIRPMAPEESGLLREFLYQAIYLPEGVQPPPRSVVELPELQVYLSAFGAQPGDHCLVAEAEGRVVGAAWSRIMADYGHIDSSTPSLAISLLPDYRGLGIGTQLLGSLLGLLEEQGYHRASLSVQKENPARCLYARTGFRIVTERDTEYLMQQDITQAQALGQAAYLAQLEDKRAILDTLLTGYNDGRRKSLFCRAVYLLPLEALQAVMHTLEAQPPGQSLKERALSAAGLLQGEAERRGICLKPRKKPKKG